VGKKKTERAGDKRFCLERWARYSSLAGFSAR
jgi:hypothetical protein